jgi:hypothetical protein
MKPSCDAKPSSVEIPYETDTAFPGQAHSPHPLPSAAQESPLLPFSGEGALRRALLWWLTASEKGRHLAGAPSLAGIPRYACHITRIREQDDN